MIALNMGQRHQAYLVARIAAQPSGRARYKCLAAVHQQWCYGRLPLRATRRFITLAKQDTTARIIREELHRLSHNDSELEKKTPSLYLVSLLTLAFHYGLEDEAPYVSGGKISYEFLPATMHTWEGDNNDGMTFIDVTDPTNCSYIFLSGSGTGGGKGQFMNAVAYARAYYPLPIENQSLDQTNPELSLKQETDVQKVIASMDEFPLLSVQALCEAWPGDFDHHEPAFREVAQVADASGVPIGLVVPSLADLTLLPVVEKAIETDDLDGIKQILWLPGKADTLLSVIRKSSAFQPITNKALPFIAEILKNRYSNSDQDTDVLDLSYFHLSPKQICLLLQEYPNIRTLDLSNNPLATISAVRAVLETKHCFRRLILLNSPVSSHDWESILEESPQLFKYLEAVIHPSFIQSEVSFSPQFLFGTLGEYRTGELSDSAMPFFTPSQVVQALLVYFRTFKRPSGSWYASYLARSDSCLVVASSETLRPGASWSERDIPYFATVPRGLVGNFAWAFFLSIEDQSYAFVNTRRDSFASGGTDTSLSPWNIYDFQGFLREMDNEGRPKPDLAMIDELEELLTNLEFDWAGDMTKTKLKIMSEDVVGKLVKILGGQASTYDT